MHRFATSIMLSVRKEKTLTKAGMLSAILIDAVFIVNIY